MGFEKEILPNNEREEIKVEEKPYKVEAGSEEFLFKRYAISKEEMVEPVLANMSEAPKMFKMYPDLHYIDKDIPGTPVPFTWLKQEGNKHYGDYTTPQGQKEFLESDLVLVDEFNPPPDVAELWKFTGALTRLTREPFRFDQVKSGLRSLDVVNGHSRFGVGPCPYSRFFNTNRYGAQHLALTPEEQKKWQAKLEPEKFQELMEAYKEVQETAKKIMGTNYSADATIDQVLKSKYPNLADFNEQTRGDVIGVAGMVLTNNGEFVFVNRGKNVAINQGINCTASGSVMYDKELLNRFGIADFTSHQMAKETKEELGFKSGDLLLASMQRQIELELGLDKNDFSVIPVGFLRELRQGSSPESMFLIKYNGTTDDVIKSIINNADMEGSSEIDKFVYSLKQEDVARLVQNPEAARVVQDKGLANLKLAVEYLKNHSS